MSELKITIVTAVYNGEKYIEECIKSIMNQTYQNFEHIIMDGGSTDNTLEIAKKYEKLYNVKIYSRKDNGMYDAIANGFELATGDILCWLNSDDMLMPWAFEVMQKVISETKAQWCMGFPTYWNDNNISRCQFRISTYTRQTCICNAAWIKKRHYKKYPYYCFFLYLHILAFFFLITIFSTILLT